MGMNDDQEAQPASGPVDAAQPAQSEPDTVDSHDTLKYHLLGPSLTKAGQDTVDQRKVSEIIYEASKGSKFFNNEEVKDKNLTIKINRILAKKRQLERLDLSADLRRADEYISQLELGRDLSQTVIHIDCDAFYAAVEELDRPELRDVPMAVGKGVLTTCNYHARKFGCRSGMAGFVARKLCPQLICLPLNFDKYVAKAKEVRTILSEYDPRFESASIDEAYLNITEYCERTQRDPQEVVSQLRAEVFEQTKVTISAGIAANGKLAKICSNKNKPNGQFFLPSDRSAIIAFMRDLPTRKVNGIGRVFERELDAIGIKTCGDIYSQRQFLRRLFGEKAFEFLMNCHLGIGRTRIQPAEEYERKSVGTESTFRDISSKEELRARLQHTAEELEKDLKRTEFKGRTLVLKIKLHTYEVFTRQTVIPKAICSATDLYQHSLPMLTKLEKEIPGMTLRLMGLRMTHLVSTKKDRGKFFDLGRRDSAEVEQQEANRSTNDGWQVWPEAEFEEAARQERQDELEELEALSQDHEGSNTDVGDVSSYRRHGKEIEPNPIPKNASPKASSNPTWRCPICDKLQAASDRAFNEHIDYCISRSAIQEAVEDSITQPMPAPAVSNQSALATSDRTRKRRKITKDVGHGSAREAQKRLFFS